MTSHALVMDELQLPSGRGDDRKASLRAYVLEGAPYRMIDKEQFDAAQAAVNDCQRAGILPVDFVAEDEPRKFVGIETPDERTPEEFLAAFLEADLQAEETYGPDWWADEEWYLQMVVEKVDLKTLFAPVYARYHIPIATARGWSSILQRAAFARRFREAEERGLKSALLYAGDYDPDGLRISAFLKANLEEIRDCRWRDGSIGYDPSELTIFRFGLNLDFIEQHGLTWIDNLHTGSPTPCRVCGGPKRLDDPHHPNHHMPYVQEYLRTVGVRKCEANALVVAPAAARQLCESAIVRFVGSEALSRFEDRRQEVRDRLMTLDRRTHYKRAILAVLDSVGGQA